MLEHSFELQGHLLQPASRVCCCSLLPAWLHTQVTRSRRLASPRTTSPQATSHACKTSCTPPASQQQTSQQSTQSCVTQSRQQSRRWGHPGSPAYSGCCLSSTAALATTQWAALSRRWGQSRLSGRGVKRRCSSCRGGWVGGVGVVWGWVSLTSCGCWGSSTSLLVLEDCAVSLVQVWCAVALSGVPA